MSESSDNPDPKEATEARLCAYLEGEMAPAERAEIEKYLQANPQHRQLMVDLAKTRTWMASLPREAAPPDIAEAFQGQLERSMLLDGTGGSEPTAGVNRLPQALLAAAIVVLAAGLGVVVYFTLPGTPPPKFTAFNPPSTPATAPTPRIESIAGPAASSSLKTLTTNGAKQVEVQPPFESLSHVARASKPEDAKDLVLGKSAERATQDAQKLPEAAAIPAATDSKLASEQPLPANLAAASTSAEQSLRIVVLADDPSAASQQIQTYLTTNHIAYEIQPASDKTAQAGAKVNSEARHGAEQDKEIVPNGSAQFQARVDKGVDQSSSNVAGQQQQFAGGQQQVTLPLDQKLKVQKSATQPAKSIDAVDAIASSAGEVFIARDLTPQQAKQVSDDLSKPRAGQIAEVSAPLMAKLADQSRQLRAKTATLPSVMVGLGATTAPTTAPAALIAKDQALKVTVDQLVGPGVDKINMVRVGNDGTINLPMLIESVHAAGMTPEELAKRIAAKYREANLIADATVRVDLAGAVPTKIAGRATSQPTVVGSTQPTTGPATPIEAGRVNVVIVIQKAFAPINAPTTQPVTQPALVQPTK